MKRIIILLILLFSLNGRVAYAQSSVDVFYVAPNGSGTSCTQSNPCSLTTPSVGVGDTLYLESGIYFRSTVLNFSNSGLPDLPITISAAPGSHPVISGDVNHNNAVDQTDGPRTNGESKYTPLVWLSGSYITFSGIEIEFSGGRGLQSGGRNNTITGNITHHAWNEALYIYGPYNTVENNTIYRGAESNYCDGQPGARQCNGNWPGGFSWGWSGEANAPGLANHITVRGNTVYNNSGEGLLCIHTDYSTVENNTVYDNWGLGIDLDKCSYATVRNNYIYYTADKSWWRRGTVGSATRPADGIFISNEYTQASGDPYPSGHDRAIENNLIVGAGGGLFFWGGDGDYSDNALVNDLFGNNTIVVNQGLNSMAVIIDYGPHSNTKIKNNIINQSSGTPVSAPTNVMFGSNLYWTLAGPGGILADPLFLPDYRPQSGSPACLTDGYIGAFPCVVPVSECVIVTWPLGLTLRDEPSLYTDNRPFSKKPTGFLYPGNTFLPLSIVDNDEGKWAQYSNNGYVAMRLADGREFSKFIACPVEY